MDLAVAYRHARAIWRVERAQRQIVERSWRSKGVRRAGRGPGWPRALWLPHEFVLGLPPVLVPVFVECARRSGARGWWFAAAVVVLVIGGHMFQAKALSSTPPASSRDAKKLGAWKAVSRKP